jgi:hypothetical protein
MNGDKVETSFELPNHLTKNLAAAILPGESPFSSKKDLVMT